jgi:hypothetical protein
LDGIEFYLPQLAHMIIHLEVEWDDAILERFVLVIAQQSIHFALQLNWILQGALQDYQPEQLDGSPNETYNPKFYTRCLKLLKNLERCVVYGKPVSQELQRLYERGQINQSERELLEQADRRFNALQITTNPDDTNYGAEGTLDGWVDVDFVGTGDFVGRFASLNRSVLDFFTTGNSCGGGGLKLDRAVALQGRTIAEGEGGCMILIKQTKDHAVSIRCSSVEDKTLWMRRLKEESNTGGLFSRRDLKNDLTQTQLDRYEFFDSERTFVKSLTDLAEELRFKDRMERKKLAPELAEHIKIPSIAYLPLCNSSDIWRRVACVIPKPTRVFNTKERCPVIFYFVSSRGEKVKRTKNDPNLDVAEFLHAYFNVTKNEIDHVPEESQNSDETGQTEDVTTDDPIKQSEHSGAWAAENEEAVEVPITPAERHPKGNIKVQRLLKESVVTLPTKLAKRLGRGPRKSVMDRQTEMQPVVQILENRWAGEADNASVGDGTVVSVERSSILVKDRILFGGLDEGNIDLASMDRAKKHICNGKTWAEQSATMLEEIQVDASEGVQHEIISCMSKSNDDLRQEVLFQFTMMRQCEMLVSHTIILRQVFVMQMIHYFKSVFAQANLPLWLKTYRILSTSSSDGLIEVLVDATSVDGLKKSEGYPEEGGLRKYFETVYGGPDSEAFKEAQNNFMQSLAGYALVSYLLGLKDRHNGNIMIDTRGHLIFIDFGSRRSTWTCWAAQSPSAIRSSKSCLSPA